VDQDPVIERHQQRVRDERRFECPEQLPSPAFNPY